MLYSCGSSCALIAPLKSAAARTTRMLGWYGTRRNNVSHLSRKATTMASAAYRRLAARRRNKKTLSSVPVVPSSDIAHDMPLSCREMDNSTLVTLAAMEHYEATVEMLIRHIMSVDGVNYEHAINKFGEIRKVNEQRSFMRTIPLKLSITLAVTAGFASIPLCFHLPTVDWFNEAFVTADVPPAKDLETWLEVGSWSWNWMEPPLGQISFFLLCMQYASDQLRNLGIRPYVGLIKEIRAERLVRAFPQYDVKLLEAYSKSSSLSKG